MKEIIKYLYASIGDRCWFDSPAKLSFEIGRDFIVSISFETEEEFSEDFLPINSTEDLDAILNFVNDDAVSEIKISLFEYLGYRDDVMTFNPDNEQYYYDELPISIANSTTQLVKQIKGISRDLVTNYTFEIDDPSGGYCDVEPNYLGEIWVNPEKITLENIEEIVLQIKNFEPPKLDCRYCLFFLKKDRPRNNFIPQFVNTNTKVRRLGYLKIFFKFIQEKKKVPENFLNNKFEEYALPYSSELNDIRNNKGVIQNLKGKSAEPYISLLKEFNLITTINKVTVPTKWLKVYLALRETFIDGYKEIFILDELDKIFFLETILRTDFLYSSVILEFLFINQNISIFELTKNFQGLLLEKIKNLTAQELYVDPKAVAELKIIESRVRNWKKAEVYLEHIIMPRVNWFADLELLSLSEGSLFITENGNRLLTELNSWVDIATEYIANSTDFLKRFYPQIYSMTYYGNHGTYPAKDTIIANLEKYIEKSFPLFKTLAPNRVTSSQAITFAKYFTFLQHRYSIGEHFIVKMLETKLNDKFIYKYQPRYNDGYIQKVLKSSDNVI